jgi:hypothetical protein
MATAGLALFAVLSSGCATMFVDTGLKDVAASEYTQPPQVKPVQMLFNFQTKGAGNARATKFLAEEVNATVKASGLFSEIGSQPVAGGALISVTINNVPVTDNAFSKGFATGLTFGLAGNTVTDGYICVVDYTAAPGMPMLEAKTRHAIHTNIGAKKAPANGVRAKSPEEAVKTMTRQIVGNALKQLSNDPEFAK